MANEWRRPRTDDDEEELLRQQEEFLRAKQPLPVKLVNSKGSAGQSKSQSLNSKKLDVVSTSQGVGEVINPDIRDRIEEISKKKLEDAIHDVPTVSSSVIIGNIVEKKFHGDEHKFDNNCLSTTGVLGFPKVFKYESNVPSTDKVNSKHSLFWHKIKSQKTSKDNVAKIQKDESSICCNKEETDVATDSQLTIEIHKENLEKLAQMSQAEILTEKKKLEETLDPKIIQFLRNKRNHKSGKRSVEQNKLQPSVSAINNETTDTEPPDEKKIKLLLNDNNVEINCENNVSSVSTVEETVIDTEVSGDKTEKILNDDKKMDCKDDILNIPESPKEILVESKQKGWLHMDRPEPEKLKWMEDLPEKKKDEPMLNEEYNARFDFKGLLLPYKDENLTMDKGLHHHGEEPDRPGYSLQELLQLSRSSTQQQRCTALTTLANVMEKTHKGWYDKALYPAPLTALSQKNILLLLRFSLDDTSVAVITAALQALRAFLVSEADEVCLDRLHGFGIYEEPTLMPQLEEKETDSLKDHELAQLDAVATLMRTDILKRIRYILNEIRPPAVGVKCALEILIRLARHSHVTVVNIASMADLLNIIVKNFMPLSIDQLAMQDTVNNAYGVPVVEAIKLCRVLVTYGKKPIAQELKIIEVVQIILTYITSDTGKNYNTNLGIESLRLWQMLLHYEVSLDSVSAAVLILDSQLQLLLCNHDIQNTSELACEYAAALITVTSYNYELMPHVSTLLEKWSVQFSSVSQPTWCVMKLIAETLLVVYTKSKFRTTRLSTRHVFATIRSSSNLLSDCKLAADRIPSCLSNLDVVAEDGKLQPLVSVNSCIPFLATLLNTYISHSCVIEIRAIIEHSSFYKYMRDLEAIEWNLERSWYTRMELYLLTAVVKGAHLLRDTINNLTLQIIWKINIKLISALPIDATDQVKELLEIALSNEKVNLEIITNEFNKLNLTSVINQNKMGLCSNAASLYQRYVVLKDEWNQAAMPKDWLFLPLVHIYTKCKNNVKLQPEDKDSVRTVLSLALILPDLIEKLSPTLRFSRLLLVYLCDTVYLDKDVSVLVSNVVSSLLRKYHARFNFQMELPGLNSFVDLFTALCEHFCSNSYGDDGFAMVLLVPMAQRHDAHYRKLLWSEHAAALRYLRLPWDKLLVPAKEYFYPEEEDTSLIESYITALVRETIKETWCPIPFAIAVHHSAMYLKRNNKLATRMRTQMEKLRNRDIADKLLHYAPSQL